MAFDASGFFFLRVLRVKPFSSCSPVDTVISLGRSAFSLDRDGRVCYFLALVVPLIVENRNHA